MDGTCVHCGKPLTYKQGRAGNRFCSNECSRLAMVRPPARYCLTCRKLLRTKQRDNKYCSRLCAKERHRNNDRVKDPTPRQIAIRAAKIRATWSDETRQKRAGVLYQTPLTIPAIRRHNHDESFVYDAAKSVTCVHVAEPSTPGPKTKRSDAMSSLRARGPGE